MLASIAVYTGRPKKNGKPQSNTLPPEPARLSNAAFDVAKSVVELVTPNDSDALAPFARPLFTLGREPLAHLDEIPPHQFWFIRCLDAHEGNHRARVIDARGPFDVDGERIDGAEPRDDDAPRHFFACSRSM